MDDLHLVPHLSMENIDYMGSCHIPNEHLHICWRSHKATASGLASARLQNIAWRRWSKQLWTLPETSPAAINWNKSSDVTWLYGPKYVEQRPFEATPPLTKANLSKLAYEDSDTESELFSVDSTSSMTFSEASADDELSDDESCFSLKPALKPPRMPFGRQRTNKRKKVTFNYIVSSREYLNEFKFDYDFLDTRFV